MAKGTLAERVAAGPYWQLVRPVMLENERPVHFAHLRCVQGAQDFSGTLFVTSHQVIWRTIDPRMPEGSAFELRFPDVTAVERPSRVAMFHAFRLVTEDGGRPVDVYFFPQHKTDVDRILCDQMYDAVQSTWARHDEPESASA
ncbi:PH domain-containing protein [Nocardioides campestrisoli]|uniref:hypothetical protein n=1 Tax=Nocardioides campestrisoli TaxID=2736757 RepID=UPI0015E63023|nr:hypothetical protein [Nocardioides campestrisoli]